MALPTKHIIHQRQVIASLGGTALSAIVQGLRKNGKPAETWARITPEDQQAANDTLAYLPRAHNSRGPWPYPTGWA